jgi:hypothetical protein
MRNIMKRTTQIPATNSALPIDAQIADLRRRRAGIVEEIVALEAMGATQQETRATTNIEQQALALLSDPDAKVVAAPAPPSANARLIALYDLLKAHDRALVLAEQRSTADHGARSRELAAEHAPQWADAQRRRAVAVIELLKSNREIENLKKSMTSGGQFAGVALDGLTPRLFGVGSQQNPLNHFAIQFLKDAARLKLIDEADYRDV